MKNDDELEDLFSSGSRGREEQEAYDPRHPQRTRADEVLAITGGGRTLEESLTCSSCKSVNTNVRGNGVSGTQVLRCRDCGYKSPIGERVHSVVNLNAQQAARPGPYYRGNTPLPEPQRDAPGFRKRSRPVKKRED